MEIKDIRSLYRFMKNTDIEELELEDQRGRIRIKRWSAGVKPEEAQRPATPEPLPEAAPPEKAAPEKKANIKVITSPMVGTFYRAPAPDADPFVDVGSTVRAGQVVCIIEAMKIMNEVESEYTGKVVSVLVENGQPVEYGEPLFEIEVSS
ncbi:MAG TPA: acetyl-CoA carboxylase biotin carboxyl carrier protein [Deltaproteobacteria bacterium]|nr:acetyl-CoA carboxylase biotin carboxyl carrier protein [Deltaproteobacteria bacterium]